ncbi:GlxA family transcriptional regulator [Dyella thiooxydans]|uniref:GlxA family transcriptional regulator n=1 Tax=Dyella thiooxydans TaxID=445710 RepID=UPI0007C5D27E|nr:helix-turn-helix domain-containing protein [Dyella thiooxydans]
MADRKRRVAVVAFDGIGAFHLAVPCAVFGTPAGGGPLFEVQVCAIEPGELRSEAGFGIAVRHGLGALARADIVVVPSWRDPAQAAPLLLLRALRSAHRRGALVVGLCLGAFVLADAGLLDGRRAATHWVGAGLFAQRFPQVTLEPDVLYVDAGPVVTSAGTAAGIDCCLHVVRRLYGVEVAARIARRMVVPPHRQGGQAQYIEQPVPARVEPGPLQRALDWATGHLDQPHSLDTLAARAAMSRRSFTRHFRRHTGTTVSQWLLGQRLALAQRLLETSDQPVERIAERAGFGTPLSMRQHFATAFDTTPSAYRREFRGR